MDASENLAQRIVAPGQSTQSFGHSFKLDGRLGRQGYECVIIPANSLKYVVALLSFPATSRARETLQSHAQLQISGVYWQETQTVHHYHCCNICLHVPLQTMPDILTLRQKGVLTCRATWKEGTSVKEWRQMYSSWFQFRHLQRERSEKNTLEKWGVEFRRGTRNLKQRECWKYPADRVGSVERAKLG